MKKRLFVLTVVVLVVIIAVLSILTLRDDNTYVAKSDDTVNASDDWSSAYVKFANEQGISIVIDDGTTVKLTLSQGYLTESRELMLSKDIVRDVFDCAVNVYEESRVVIAKGRKQVSMIIGETEATVITYDLVQTETEIIEISTYIYEDENGILYIPSELISKGLGFEYSWNREQLVGKFVSADPEVDSIPYYYSTIDANTFNTVRSQGNLGACWAFASLTALESSLYPEEIWDFSEDHMLYNNYSDLDLYSGGDYLMAVAYLLAWTGPVKEEDDPYNDGYTDETLSAVKHVQEVRFLESKDYGSIKQMIFKYGAVETSIYIAVENDSYVDPTYYDYGTYSYCYDGNEIANHEIVIIGWDDNYPKENFGGRADTDGAFICKNSWGSSFGDNGIFYVSYSDAIIGTTGVVYTKVEETDNYDNIYQYDFAGMAGTIGYGRNEAYMANVFTAAADENIEAVGFYVTGTGTKYKVYIIPEYDGVDSLSIEGEVYAEGILTDAGYYTIELSESVQISAGNDYAVIVMVDTSGSGKPIAVDIDPDDSEENNSLNKVERSFISNYGHSWEETQSNNSCTVCLKVYTSSY